MPMERTLVLLKPDAIQRGLIGEIIHRYEAKGLKIIGLKMLNMTEEMAARHYRDHVGKEFYAGLVKFMTTNPIVAIALEGVAAISVCRKLNGATFGVKAEPGTIRGDYALSTTCNVVHASENLTTAAWEIPIFFSPCELINYTRYIDNVISTGADIAKSEEINKEKK